MMERYPEYSARCAYLEGQIRENKRMLMEAQSELIEDMISITPRLTGMPGAQQGTSDPTGRVGVLVAEGHKTKIMIDLEMEMEKLQAEHDVKYLTVIFVEAWLKVLDEKERFVVEKKVLGGLSWKQLIYTFRQTFGDLYTQQGLRRIRDSAMEKIYRIAV